MFANEILVCFLVPIHMGLHRIYHIATTVIHEGRLLVIHSTAAAAAACVQHMASLEECLEWVYCTL